MAKTDLYSFEGEKVDSIELPDSVFGIEPNIGLMHTAVVIYLGNIRTAHTIRKNRSMVSGSNAKPFRQKGTGRARQGTKRAPHFVGGGRAFGGQRHNYKRKLNRKMRRVALRSAFSAKFQDGEITIIEQIKLDEPKTKIMASFLSNFDMQGKRNLLIVNKRTENLILATRNIPEFIVHQADLVNVYDLINADRIFILQESIEKIDEIWGNKPKTKK